MSSRLHNKFHRHNHHTTPINDPRYPDAAHDPIASPESPFQGDFVLQGNLSASGNIQFKGVINISNPSSIVTFSTTSLSAAGEYLFLTVDGQPRYIRLWKT